MSELHILATKHGTEYRHNDSDILLEDDGTYVHIIEIHSQDQVLIATSEWSAFVEMVNAVNRNRKHE